MKRNIKTLIFFIILLLLIIIPISVNATSSCTILEEQPLADQFKSDDYSSWEPKSTGTYNDINNIGGKITGFIQIVGSVFSVAALVIIGIKYMLGSAEEKADYKKTMIPYIVGCLMVFACSALPKIIYNIANNF